jgi:hypothetical protein
MGCGMLNGKAGSSDDAPSVQIHTIVEVQYAQDV